MTLTPVFVRRRASVVEHPVELRFVDMLLIIIATLMFVTIVLSVVSAFSGSGRPDVAPRITTRSAPAAITGQPYQLTLAVEGGDGDYAWQADGGELPAGLQLREDGIVEGTPAGEQTTGVNVRVSDGSGRVSAPRELSFSVRPSGAEAAEQVPPRIANAVILLDDAVAGQPYNHKFVADSGTSYRWSSSALPSGLELAPDGTLAGRPEAGTSTFTVAMTEGSGDTAGQEVRLVVREEPASLFWQILDWLVTIIKWIGYVLFTITVLTLLIGAPASGGHEGLLRKIFKRDTGR